MFNKEHENVGRITKYIFLDWLQVYIAAAREDDDKTAKNILFPQHECPVWELSRETPGSAEEVRFGLESRRDGGKKESLHDIMFTH